MCVQSPWLRGKVQQLDGGLSNPQPLQRHILTCGNGGHDQRSHHPRAWQLQVRTILNFEEADVTSRRNGAVL